MELDWLLLSVTGILTILVLYLSLSLHRTNHKLEEQAKYLEQFQKDFDALYAGAADLEEQVGQLDRRVKNLNERQDQMDLHTPEARAYSHAIKMVRSGADINQLMVNCGLPRSEAELIYLLHSADSDSNPTSGQAETNPSSR